jgi:hypothetical protein
MDSGDPRRILARRLRALREERWRGVKVKQSQLAAALGGNGRRSVSVPLISSWESQTNPVIPPAARLEDIATFFATRRSIDGMAGRLLSIENLTEQERADRNDLARELVNLRTQALSAGTSGQGIPSEADEIAASLNTGPWRFEDGNPVNVVCAQLPPEMLEQIPYTDPLDPDFISLYRYSDLDALFELYGHLRAANPTSQVNVRTAQELRRDDYTAAHLVALGGVDWNQATNAVLDLLDLPVRQVTNWKEPEGAYFEVTDEGGRTKVHPPRLEKSSGRDVLREDVALFARAVNPYNQRRSVTICNGMFGSGTYGAVRALTDALFRDRNAEYVRDRFTDSDAFCILTRVRVLNGVTLTPDWTLDETRLFEWSRPQ